MLFASVLICVGGGCWLLWFVLWFVSGFLVGFWFELLVGLDLFMLLLFAYCGLIFSWVGCDCVCGLRLI